MHTPRRIFLSGSLALLVLGLKTPQAHAETLTITSTPPGAALEIDGMPVGKTPYKVKYPGGYFHKPHTAFGARLEHAMVARFSLSGYVTQEITLTDGPLAWVAVNGKREGNYFILKSDHFNIELEPRSKLVEGAFDAAHSPGPLPYRPPNQASEHSPGQAKTDTQAQPVGAGSIAITCDPSTAEIYVDGKFVGQAPATLRLTTGSHHIEVKSAGKRSWVRDLEVMKDSQITLHPVLEPGP